MSRIDRHKTAVAPQHLPPALRPRGITAHDRAEILSDHSLVIDPRHPQRLYLGTDLGVFVSLDGGTTWAVENTGFANVVTESLVLSPPFLFAFTHGRGVWRAALPD